MFSSHSLFMGFVWFFEQAVSVALNVSNTGLWKEVMCLIAGT